MLTNMLEGYHSTTFIIIAELDCMHVKVWVLHLMRVQHVTLVSTVLLRDKQKQRKVHLGELLLT